MGYDSVGNVTWQKDPEGHVTYFDFDAGNRRVAIKDALAGVTDFYYDENGNHTILIAAEGHPTSGYYCIGSCDGPGPRWLEVFSTQGAEVNSQRRKPLASMAHDPG